jgi:hypothetical protein
LKTQRRDVNRKKQEETLTFLCWQKTTTASVRVIYT